MSIFKISARRLLYIFCCVAALSFASSCTGDADVDFDGHFDADSEDPSQRDTGRGDGHTPDAGGEQQDVFDPGGDDIDEELNDITEPGADSGPGDPTDPTDPTDPSDPQDPDPPVDCDAYRQRADLSSPGANASWKWGGGVGYPDALSPNPDCATVVRTRAQLMDALEDASRGDIVYVADDARINLSDQSVCIPGGVWLASGRGKNNSPGGMIYSNTMIRVPILKACGNDVRITGLRILGPDPTQCPAEWPNNCTGGEGESTCRYCTPPAEGIRSTGYKRTEIDNNEIAGWAHAATYFGTGDGHHLHHNHIHHNQRKGLGYGAVLMAGVDKNVSVLIEWNRFNYNRHAVAGSGSAGQDYTARNNLVLDKANGHVFDMHGINERLQDGTPDAGGEILIHDNIVLVPDHYTMVIRGRPSQGAWLYDNCLAPSNAAEAAWQRLFTGNFYVDSSPTGSARNQYGQSAGQCTPVRWCQSSGGNGAWSYATRSNLGISGLHVGDFDGDGEADIFRAKDGKWEWSKGGRTSWAELNRSQVDPSTLRFGDFNGDGKTDVFRATGSEWQYSPGGTGSWKKLRSSTLSEKGIAFGDFNGDGKTDAFRATGSKWQYSSGAATGWRDLNNSSVRLENIAFGDFDGDGKTDIFRAAGNRWEYSSGGTGSWQTLNDSSIRLDQLHLVDIDGDGVTDILRNGRDRWQVSWSGNTSWQTLRISSESLNNVLFGDFDGDGVTDTFGTGCL